jgi:ABC-2 type transport system ATP-binding protein
MSIRVENVVKYFGEQKALDNISFKIKSNEIVGFLGPNGAGKSTMMKIITGFLPASSGKVYVKDSLVESSNKENRRSIGYLPENNPLYPDMYIREYLEFVAGLYKVGKKRERVDEMIELTGLTRESHKKIKSLSKGFRQRVGLAQALIHNPDVLILDEPTTGLDPNQLVEIRQLIKNISKEKTVLFSTHIMQEVEAVCNRVIIINRGSIVADFNNEQIKAFSTKAAQKVIVEFSGKVTSEKLLSIKEIEKAEVLENNKWLVAGEGTKDIRPAIFDFAVANNLILLTVQKQETNLENVFIELTKYN